MFRCWSFLISSLVGFFLQGKGVWGWVGGWMEVVLLVQIKVTLTSAWRLSLSLTLKRVLIGRVRRRSGVVQHCSHCPPG